VPDKFGSCCLASESEAIEQSIEVADEAGHESLFNYPVSESSKTLPRPSPQVEMEK
jgi:hypothetical protein